VKLGLLASAALFVLFPTGAPAQRVEVRGASAAYMLSRVDSNSPAYWRQGRLHILNSAGFPYRTSGWSLFTLQEVREAIISPTTHYPAWIEAAWQDEDGTLFAWYHHEPEGVCPGGELTAPKIGALVSTDGGLRFRDLGIVLESGDPPDCRAQNGFFAGGYGDFSVIRDRGKGYFYFLFSSYGGDASQQGIAMARMAFADRRSPVGRVYKYFRGAWQEPGLGGRLTPVFPVAVPWQHSDTDAFWGPSVHWNTYAQSYVMLLNRACCAPRWPQEGIYVSFSRDLSRPEGWSAPVKILDDVGFSPGWYPQVLGLEPGETDTLAGQVARLYVHGVSKWELVFSGPEGEEPDAREQPDEEDGEDTGDGPGEEPPIFPIEEPRLLPAIASRQGQRAP